MDKGQERGDNNHNSPQGSLVFVGDTNIIDTNHDSGGKAGLCIKFKVGAKGLGNNNNNDNKLPHVCHICSKGFTSANALGGHMRIHTLSTQQLQFQAKGGTDLIKTHHIKTPKTCTLVGSPTCGQGRKSIKSLFDTSSSSWPATRTAKRGRKSISSNADSGLRPGVEKRMQEDVLQLMMRVNGHKQDDVSEGMSCQKKPCTNSLWCALLCLAKAHEDTSKRKLKINEESDESEYVNNSNGNPHGDYLTNFDPGMNNHRYPCRTCKKCFPSQRNKKKQKAKKITSKTELTEFETDEGVNPLITVRANRYTCSICNKSFPSHQALGGHRSSHNKSKNIQIMDEYGSGYHGVSASEEE